MRCAARACSKTRKRHTLSTSVEAAACMARPARSVAGHSRSARAGAAASHQQPPPAVAAALARVQLCQYGGDGRALRDARERQRALHLRAPLGGAPDEGRSDGRARRLVDGAPSVERRVAAQLQQAAARAARASRSSGSRLCAAGCRCGRRWGRVTRLGQPVDGAGGSADRRAA